MKLLPAFFALVLCVYLSSAKAENSDLSEAKSNDIGTLLEMTGALAVGKQMSDAVISQMTESLKAVRPDLEPRFFDIIEDEVNQVISDALPEFSKMIVPTYHKHFTGQEIKDLIQFYSTNLGQKTIRVMPVMVQEGMIQGQKWGTSLGPRIQRRIVKRFKEEGVDLSE